VGHARGRSGQAMIGRNVLCRTASTSCGMTRSTASSSSRRHLDTGVARSQPQVPGERQEGKSCVRFVPLEAGIRLHRDQYDPQISSGAAAGLHLPRIFFQRLRTSAGISTCSRELPNSIEARIHPPHGADSRGGFVAGAVLGAEPVA